MLDSITSKRSHVTDTLSAIDMQNQWALDSMKPNTLFLCVPSGRSDRGYQATETTWRRFTTQQHSLEKRKWMKTTDFHTKKQKKHRKQSAGILSFVCQTCQCLITHVNFTQSVRLSEGFSKCRHHYDGTESTSNARTVKQQLCLTRPCKCDFFWTLDYISSSEAESI